MNWGPEDYLLASVLTGSVVFVYRLAARASGNTAYRAAVAVALAAAFILIWVNGAVGIIGGENNDANLMYFGVLAIAVVGAFVAHFRPRGLVFAMYATAAAQLLVAVVALALQLGREGASWPNDVLAATAFFILLWLVSARLFHAASVR